MCHNVGYSLVCERESVQAEESASKESVIIVVQVELSKELAEKPDLHLTFQRPNWASKPFWAFQISDPKPVQIKIIAFDDNTQRPFSAFVRRSNALNG